MKSTDFTAALAKLRAQQPEAHAVRRQTCHCPRRQLLLSYCLPIPPGDEAWAAREAALHADGQQTCGYFCAACNFSNAGSRPITWLWGEDA